MLGYWLCFSCQNLFITPCSQSLLPCSWKMIDIIVMMVSKLSLFSLPLQICIEGTCLPFYPQGIINPEDPGQDIEDDNSIDTSRPVQKDFQQLDIIDGRPAWYDPIFTEMFIELEMKFKQRFLKTF